MKLLQLFEGRNSPRSTPVSFEFEQEVMVGPDEAEYQMLTINGIVEIEPDPYGTGDSPTSRSFEIISACVTASGEKVDVNSFSDEEYSHIEDMGIQKAE